MRKLLVRGNNALLGLELAKASDVKSQRRLLGWWTELLGKGGQNVLGHGEDHLVVVAQKYLKDCDGSMRSFRGVQEVLPKRYTTNQETELMEMSEMGLL